jgi:hypothetical protein
MKSEKTGTQLRAEIEARMRHYAKTSPLFNTTKEFDAAVKAILKPKPLAKGRKRNG